MPFIHSDSSTVDLSASAPNATGYLDMLLKLIDFASNSSAATVAINSGGTNYNVGDIVELDGGTHPTNLANCRATFEVTSVSSGVVDGIRFRDTGSYATTPGTTGVSTTKLTVAGTGSGLTLNMTYSSALWSVERRTQEITGATIVNGGTGYGAGGFDLDVEGGDTRNGYSTPQSEDTGTLTITSTSGGVIDGISVNNPGTYHNTPANPVQTTSQGTGDNAATFNLTYSDVTDRDIEVWLESTAGAVAGIRSFNNGSSIYNWELAMAPTFTAANNFDAQVNVSPGRYPDNDEGSYVVLRNVAFNYYIRVTERYIAAVFNIDNGVYTNMYIGLMNPYATATEYAYPGLILGCSSIKGVNETTDATRFAGMNAAVAANNNDDGPAQFYSPGGSWIPFYNGYGTSTEILGEDNEFHILPGGNFSTQSTVLELADRITHNNTSNSQKQDWGSFASVATATGASGEDAPTERFRPTPQTGGGDDQIYLAECIVLGIEPVNLIAGEIDGIKQLDRELNSGTINAEDVIVDADGTLWVVFNNCKLTDRQHWFAMKAGL
jgi:hypothetical protein